jgi:serine/threonine protein kinase
LLVTELCGGGSLYNLIHDISIPLSNQQIFHFISGIASGINHLHKCVYPFFIFISQEREGIVHRDLAARNILLTTSMDVKGKRAN